MKITRFISLILLLAMLIWTAGCAAQKPTPDPLAGFHFSSLNNLNSNKVITDDYQDYVRNLPSGQSGFTGVLGYSEDGTGQHAVTIQIGVNGTWWVHILIYDKENKRVKVIKYKNGGYRS